MISKGVKSIFPIKNQEIWDRYKLHIQAFWTPEEVSLHEISNRIQGEIEKDIAPFRQLWNDFSDEWKY